MNTAEKHIFKYVVDCSGGIGDKFLARIVLTGIEIISSRYFVFCSCFQGAAPAALSTDRMDGLCFALSSLPDLDVLLPGLRGIQVAQPESQPGLVEQPEVDGINNSSVEVISGVQTFVRLQLLSPSEDASSEGTSVLHRYINCLYLLPRVTEVPLEDLNSDHTV